MKDPITLILKLLGYEVRKPSLLLMHMMDVTHEPWLGSLRRHGRFSNYIVKK
jgi:hypothetical protein